MNIKVVDGEVFGVYSEAAVSALRSVGLALEFERISVIEPVESGAGFQIVWRNQKIIEKLGEQITLDNGAPFPTYGAAVIRERELVDKLL